ncbi:MAG: rhodanese-like domain-containing protein [Alphaproteobacteria bacterium]
MTEIDRDQVKRMMDENAAVIVEVLDQDQYKEFHLPSAINVPVGGNFEELIQTVLPAKHQPVIVYCMNEDCDASPKAAERMQKLGYERVYDYAAGKVDWKQAGLPVEEAAKTVSAS